MPQVQTRHQQIEQALRAAGIHPGMYARTALIQRAATVADDGSMDWTLTTEKPARVFDWNQFDFVDEVLLMDGMLVPANGQVPFLDCHNRQSATDVIGHVEQFSDSTSGQYAGKNGRVFFAADTESQCIRQKVVDGHITDGSVGYQVNKSVWIPEGMEGVVNGKVFQGPLKVSYEWSLMEFSATPIGADALAKVRLLCG